jgi:hypothetical protein
MELKQPLPANRSLEQLKNHYLVEKAIAERLKLANREERKQICATMYDELFSKVPDHPLLTRREGAELTRRANESKSALVRRRLEKSMTFVEFAPGDCQFAFELCKHVDHVYGVDISDQSGRVKSAPENFTLIIYGGYHLEMVYSLLKSGGFYVFRTPQYHSGPHDVSRSFSNEPECFHLKEWTYSELMVLLKEVGYGKLRAYWTAKDFSIRLPYAYFSLCDALLRRFPKRRLRRLAKLLMPCICIVAVKG